MKTTLVHLESFDNTSSIVDKIEGSRSARIILVWPRRGRLLLSRLDLEILMRKVKSLGAEFAIVSHDQPVIESANTLGIPTFLSVTKAEEGDWGKKNKINFKKATQKSYQVISDKKKGLPGSRATSAKPFWRVISSILSFSSIIFLLIFLIPSAKITVYPQIYEKTVTISIWASPLVSEVNVNGNLPAIVSSVTLEQVEEGQSTGFTNLPMSYAEGTVNVANLTGEEINIPSGTILYTTGENPIRFATQELVSLGPNESNIPINVKAVEAGISGNIDAGSVINVEGPLGASIWISNNDAFSGGLEKEVPSPTEEDYALLKMKLINEMVSEANDEFNVADQQLIAETMNNGTIITETRSVEPGQPSDRFSLTLKVEFSGLTYRKSDYLALLNQAMDVSLGNDEVIVGEGIKIPQVNVVPEASLDGAKWIVQIKADVGTKINFETIGQMIAGKSISEAETMILQQIPSRQDALIQLTPSFWPRIPLAYFRTQIEEK